MSQTVQIYIKKKDKDRLDKEFDDLFLKEHPELQGMQLSYAYKIEKILNYYLKDEAIIKK